MKTILLLNDEPKTTRLLLKERVNRIEKTRDEAITHGALPSRHFKIDELFASPG